MIAHRVQTCTVCGASTRFEDQFRDIVLYRCPACDHCLTDVGALEHLGEYDEAWEALHPNWFENPNARLFELVEQTIGTQGPDARVLDVGSGRGELLEYLRRRKPRLALTGLDLALNPQIEGVEMIVADIADADLGGRRWDVVTSLATIEHLVDVRQFVQRLHDLVEPHGVVVIMTIDDRSILYETARRLKRFGYRTAYERLYDRFHLNHFNSRSLRTLIEQGGFDVVAHHHHNIPLAAVDMPTQSALLRFGVLGTFALGRLTRRTYEQTLVARPQESA